MRSSAVYLADTRPHSPTTLAYEPITHTSFIGSTHTIYREADHALTCAYRLLSLPMYPLGSHSFTPSHYSFPDGALDPPSSSPPPYPRRHCQPPVIIFPLPPNTTRDPLFFAHDRRQDQATRRVRQARAQRQGLATQQRPQLKSHSPVPLGTPLRL